MAGMGSIAASVAALASQRKPGRGKPGGQRQMGQKPMKPQTEVLNAAPVKPAWQQLRDAGMQGQGSAAANRAAAAGLPGNGGQPQITSVPMRPANQQRRQGGAVDVQGAGMPSGDMGGPGSDIGFSPASDAAMQQLGLPTGPQFQSGGGFMGEPMPMGDGGGMAGAMNPANMGQILQRLRGMGYTGQGSTPYLPAQQAGGGMMPMGANLPPQVQQQLGGFPVDPSMFSTPSAPPSAPGATGPMAGQQKPGVNSNAFAAQGTDPRGRPLQGASGPGQAARLQRQIGRVAGGYGG